MPAVVSETWHLSCFSVTRPASLGDLDNLCAGNQPGHQGDQLNHLLPEGKTKVELLESPSRQEDSCVL